MEDFCNLIRQALEQNSIKRFLHKWNADPNLKFSVSSDCVFISDYAFSKSRSGYNSLEHIYHRSDELDREIPFAAIFDEKNLLVLEFIKGMIGKKDGCAWDDGTLLSRSFAKADSKETKVSLGHTHPFKPLKKQGAIYSRRGGAICSDARFTKKELKDYGEEFSLKILESGIYKNYGADYCGLLQMIKMEKLVSGFSWIFAPGLNQIGVFEAKEEGNIVYHPWKITKKILWKEGNKKWKRKFKNF